jgi:transposase
MVQRGGLVNLKVLPNVQQKTIKPIIESGVEKGSTFYTDEYNIYNKVGLWGMDIKR